MTNAAIAANFHQTFDVQIDFTAKFAFYMKVMINIFSQFGNVVLVEIFDARIGIDARFRKDLFRRGQPDSVDIGQTNLCLLYTSPSPRD